MSTIKVDTIATRTGSGSITVSNNTSLSGTLGVTGAITGTTQTLNRSGNGVIQTFQKDGSTIGQISGTIGLIVGTGDTGLGFQTSTGDAIIPQRPDTQAGADNLLSFGNTSYRFKDMYLGGGLYVGGTGAANKLDDYEEGTYDVTMTPGTSGSITVRSDYNTGGYVKVGNLVTVYGYVVVSSISSPVGHIDINLPFAVSNTSEGHASAAIYVHISTLTGKNTNEIGAGIAFNNQSLFRVYSIDGTGRGTASANALTSSSSMYFSGSYKTG